MGEGGRNRAVQVACPLSWGRSIKYIHRVTTPTSTLCAFSTYSKALRHIILSIHRHRHHQPRHAPPKHNLSTLARPSPSPQTPFFPLPEPSPPASPTHHPNRTPTPTPIPSHANRTPHVHHFLAIASVIGPSIGPFPLGIAQSAPPVAPDAHT